MQQPRTDGKRVQRDVTWSTLKMAGQQSMGRFFSYRRPPGYKTVGSASGSLYPSPFSGKWTHLTIGGSDELPEQATQYWYGQAGKEMERKENRHAFFEIDKS